MTPDIQQREGIAFLQATSPYERDATVHALFSRIASEHPDRLAALSEQASLTYAQLHAHALGVAAALRKAGVAPGENVAILCERSVFVPAAMLGILFAGAVFVPLDPRAPLPRNARIAELARCRVVISNGPATPAGVPVLSLDHIAPVHGLRTTLRDATQGEYEFHGPIRANGHTGNGHAPGPPALDDPASNRPVPGARMCHEREATDAASVMFTSGSTGEPKGVLIPHRAIVRLCRNNWFFRATPDTRFLHLSSLAFDASTLEIWAPLLNGGCIAVAPPGPGAPGAIAETVRTLGVNACFLTTSLFNLLVDKAPALFCGLGTVITGGEVASPGHVAALRRMLPHLRIVNGYGPTESTTFVACHVVDEVDVDAPVPIGRPVSNSAVCIVDRELNPVPVGRIGELVAIGDGLALGYLHAPEETERRFVDLPGLGVRGYRTGDRARLSEDGILEFHGREDDQLKLNGHRVEPSELETFVRRLPGVRDAAVVAAARRPGQRALYCFVTVEPTESWPDHRATLMNRMRAELPAWMLPEALSRYDTMPLGPTGKLDRSTLRERIECGELVAEDWTDALPSEFPPAAWLVALGIALSRVWRPYEPGAVALRHPGGAVDFSVQRFEDATAEEIAAAVAHSVPAALPHSAALIAELSTPEGDPAEVIGARDLRLALPADTSEEVIRWRVQHLSWLLRHVSGGPGSGDTICTPSELRAIEHWNGPRWDHGFRSTLVHLFEESAGRMSECEALRSDDYSLSYGQLLRQANAVARTLSDAGVQPGDRVGIYDTRAISVVAAVLGILRTGATCVPLDADAPDAVTDLMLREAGARFLAWLPGQKTCRSAGLTVVPLTPNAESSNPPPLAADPAGDAFVLFTSGSTGRRKGVPIRHESILNCMAWMQRLFALRHTDMVAQRNRLSWDGSILEYLWPLAFGSRSYVMSALTIRDPARLHECMRSNGVTVVQFVPSLLTPFARASRSLGDPGLRLTISGGEALSDSTAREYLASVSGDLYNIYGPTETAVWVAGRYIRDGVPVTIGRPNGNVRIDITDPRGRPCPVGATGEVRISGVQVSRHYCGERDGSPDPFEEWRDGPQEWPTYRAGDLARWREDGEIEFVGRRDAQVQLYGMRLQVEEIEAALVRHDAVADAAVCKVGQEHDAQLVALCVAGPSARFELEREVRAHLRASIEESLVPTRFVWVSQIPRLSNGKVDRRRVDDLASARPQEMTANGSAGSVVAAVWERVLGSPPRSSDENFMDAGGNSLAFLRLMLEVERALGCEVPAAPVMAEPTLGAVTATVEAVLRERGDRGRLWQTHADPAPGSAGELVRLTYGEIPLLVLSHIGGTMGFLSDVLPHVAGKLAVYGFRPRGLFDGEAPVASVCEMIDGYAGTVLARGWRSVCVLGFSSGTIHGLALANELRARGVQVPLVSVVDSSLLVTARGRLHRFARACAGAPIRAMRGERAWSDGADQLGHHVTDSQRQLMRAHLRALRAHSPARYDGRVLLFASTHSRRQNGLAAWRSVLRGPAHEVLVDAGHMEMWKQPHAAVLARELLTHVREAAAGEGERGPRCPR